MKVIKAELGYSVIDSNNCKVEIMYNGDGTQMAGRPVK